ncbi:hypothetical protein N9S94_01360 [Candidatus Actinomarina]|jgi:hypothetical protein|nr:hypothetical protein [Candidatus Actinomarina sp.]
MNKISIFTTMTNPESRGDPWKEALKCYEAIADEVVIVGENWPYEFTWDHIGKTFQEGFDKCSGDWVIRMDLDYFLHEKDFSKLIQAIRANLDSPALAFPQYQFFTPDRFQVKTKLCVALNKKKFPQIKLNGGGDLCMPTLDNVQILNTSVPSYNIPIYQYDSMFRTKSIIAEDRARFARAWNNYFQDFGDRGGPSQEEAFEAWFEMIKNRYLLHTNKISLNRHPQYIKNKLENLTIEQFGYSAFGLQNNINRQFKEYIKGYKNRLII